MGKYQLIVTSLTVLENESQYFNLATHHLASKHHVVIAW